MTVRVVVYADRVRLEEKRIVASLSEWASVGLERVDGRVEWVVPPRGEGGAGGADAAVVRPVSMYLAAYTAAIAEARGLLTVNPSEAILYSGDKLLAYARLASHGVRVPATGLLASPPRAPGDLELPVGTYVLKPPVGSWGRLVSRVDSLEDLVLHARLRSRLPCAVQRSTLVQEYVEGGDSDYRCIVVGGEGLGCIVRRSSGGEWRSNVALGARVEPVGDKGLLGDLLEASVRAAEAVGGVFVSVDLFVRDGEVLVNEVNGVPEFKGFLRAYEGGLDPAASLSEWLRRELRG